MLRDSKKQLQSKFYLRGGIVLLTIFCVLLVISVYERYAIERDMAARRVELENEFKDLEERKAALEGRVEYLSNDASVEAEIRRSFDVAREGEQVVVILDEEETKSEVVPVPAPPPRAWYEFWR